MSEKFSVKKFLLEHKRDLLLILSLVLISVLVAVAVMLSSKDGAFVKVELNGKEVARYSLSDSGEYQIGDGNLLVRQ